MCFFVVVKILTVVVVDVKKYTSTWKIMVNGAGMYFSWLERVPQFSPFRSPSKCQAP